MPEEIEAVQRATGWQFRIEVLFGDDAANIGRLTPDIAASINEGRPVLAYDKWLDMGVVYGYQDSGESMLVRSYSSEELPPSLPAPSWARRITACSSSFANTAIPSRPAPR